MAGVYWLRNLLLAYDDVGDGARLITVDIEPRIVVTPLQME